MFNSAMLPEGDSVLNTWHVSCDFHQFSQCERGLHTICFLMVLV